MRALWENKADEAWENVERDKGEVFACLTFYGSVGLLGIFFVFFLMAVLGNHWKNAFWCMTAIALLLSFYFIIFGVIGMKQEELEPRTDVVNESKQKCRGVKLEELEGVKEAMNKEVGYPQWMDVREREEDSRE